MLVQTTHFKNKHLEADHSQIFMVAILMAHTCRETLLQSLICQGQILTLQVLLCCRADSKARDDILDNYLRMVCIEVRCSTATL